MTHLNEKINFNGSILLADEPLFTSQNRAFRYGDGIFESMRRRRGDVPLWDYHFQRLRQGMKALRLQIAKEFTADFLRKEIEKLCGDTPNARLRLSVFRADGGLYTPASRQPVFLIESRPTEETDFPANAEGLYLGWYDECPILSSGRLANVKSCNALPYVMAANHCRTYGFDDCFVFNEKGYLAETFCRNVFIWKNGVLLTPALSAGCVAGVMRRALSDIARRKNIELRERENLVPEDVFTADGILLTNAVQGIDFVKNVEHVQFARPNILAALREELREFI